MTIRFHCHVCGREFTVPENLAGTRARCVTCGTIVTVPRLPEPLAELVPLDHPQPIASSDGVPKLVWVAAIGGGGLALLVLLGVVLYSTLFGGPERRVATPEPPGPVSPPPNWPTQSEATSQPFPSPAPSAGGFPPTGTLPPFLPAEPKTGPRSSPPWNMPTMPGGSTSDARSTPPPLKLPEPESRPNQPGPAEQRASPAGANASPAGEIPSLPKVPNLANLARSRSANRPANVPSAVPWPSNRDGAGGSNSSELTSWQATVDGPPQPIEYDKGKLSIPVPVAGRVVFPARPSNFVLVSGRDAKLRDAWRVYDLRNGKEIGKPVYPDQGSQPELFSPDGRYAAGRMRVTGKQVCGVWSFVSGEFVRELSLGDRGFASVGFGGPHELFSLEDTFDAIVVRVWNINSGSQTREFSIVTDRNRRPVRGALAITPGGHFASLVEGDRLSVYDLTSGACAGQTPLPGAPNSCSAMGFSPDGAELAALLSFTSGTHLLIWDFSTGSLTLDHDAGDVSPHHFYGGDLQWLPDKSALLYRGSVLLDRETGLEVWTFPEDRFNPRRMLSLERMLAVLDGRGGQVLTYIDLPEKDLQKAQETIRGGGQAVDSVLPKLVRANVLSARAMTLPNGYTNWSATPDPAGSAEIDAERDLLVSTEDESLTAAVFAGPAAGKVAVYKTASRPGGSGRTREQVAFVQRYDLKSGQKGKDVPLPQIYHMLDVAPSGDYVLVGFNQRGNGYDRLDVIRFAPLEHIAGWRPYEGEEKPESRRDDDGKLVSRAIMLDDTHVLTVNRAGKLVLWQLPDCQAVYSFADFGAPVAISPQRKYMVGVHRQEIRIFETAGGECRGDLKTPLTGVQLRRAAFRADGGQLAAVVGAGKDHSVAIWDLETGDLSAEFPLPSAVLPWLVGDDGSLEWRGGRHLMLDQHYLIDIKNRAVVWYYHVPYGSIFAARGPDHRTWYCTSRDGSAGRGPKFLVNAETPSTSAKLKTEFTTLEKQLLLGPGTSVRLDVLLSGDLKPKVEQVLTETLQARGIRVQPSAALQFLLTTQQGTTGNQLGVSDSRSPFAQPTTVFAQEEIACLMAIKDASGNELWTYQRKVNMRSFGSVKTGQAQAELSQEMRTNFERMMTSGDFIREGLPAYIFGGLDRILAGSSTLTFRGEGPPPAAPKPAR